MSHNPRPPTGRPVVAGTRGVISSGHYLTSMAGMRMMLSGGNAFDALAAGVFAAAVVEPTAAFSLASESVFMLYHARSEDLKSLSGQGVAPRRATVDFYRSQGVDVIPTGPSVHTPLSFTVPGAVHATISMLDRYGTKSLREVLTPAIQYAEDGIPNYRHMINELRSESIGRQFEAFPPGGTDVFFPSGVLPAEGSLLIQPGLANTLKSLAEAERACGGTRSEGLSAALNRFYRGGLAKLIAKSSQSVGGILSFRDLADYQSQFEDPLHTTFAGYQVYGQRTWSQAAVLLQTLNILDHFDLQALGHNTPAYIHTVIEALKLSLSDRQSFYGDPDYSEIPIFGLLSKEYGAIRAAMINPNRAWPQMPPAGDAWSFTNRSGKPGPTLSAQPLGDSPGPVSAGTTHLAAIDGEGNMACATPSGGALEKSVFFPELGCALSTRSEIFNLLEGHPNVIQPGKRPRTTLVNYIAIKDGSPVMTFGCPGGDHQTQANLQLMLNTFVFGMNPQEAIEAPRFATDNVADSFYPHHYFPGRLSLEPGFARETIQELSRLGHQVVGTEVCGVGAIITHRDPTSGVLSAGADPRRPCYAIAW